MPHEVVEVRERLADGEADLVGVERAAEQYRHDLGGGAGLGAGGFELGEARVVMVGELLDAAMQAVEGQAVRGQHQGSVGDLALELFQR